MKKYGILLMGIFLIFACPAFSAEPSNLTLLKEKIKNYYDSGEYSKDVNSQVNIAKQYLQKQIQQNTDHKKLAIVLDIDDTMLNGYSLTKKYDFSETLPLIKEKWVKNHTPIIPVLDLFNFAKQNHVAIFIISGRPKQYTDVTIKNLKLAGYSGWIQLVNTADKKIAPNVSNIKAGVRKEITDQGYHIVLNIGDQKSDLVGGYADKMIKLPNPCYFVP